MINTQLAAHNAQIGAQIEAQRRFWGDVLAEVIGDLKEEFAAQLEERLDMLREELLAEIDAMSAFEQRSRDEQDADELIDWRQRKPAA